MPVIGVGGKATRCDPKVATDDVFGPSATFPKALIANDEAFLWPRRKAVADGGGSGSTCSREVGGDGAFFGGVKERPLVGVERSLTG